MSRVFSAFSIRHSILIVCSAAILGLSFLSFLKRNGKASFGDYLHEVVEFFHRITFSITKTILDFIPYFDFHVTATNSDMLWIAMALLVPPGFIVFRDEDSNYFYKGLMLFGVGILVYIFSDLFSKDTALYLENNPTAREKVWGGFLKGVIINQVALLLYALGMIGKNAQIRAIRTYSSILLAGITILVLHTSGAINLLSKLL